MAEFGGLEDWDLQAIVGGSYNMANNNNDTNKQTCSFGITQYEEADDDDAQGFLFNYFGNSSMIVDGELEALYKPFYPVSDTIEHHIDYALKESENHQDVQGKQGHVQTPSAASPTSRKRKNQQKRVVNQVKVEDLSSDMWAWRKYGQKPIKGSPYPRSYYRCSSMKGCLARKQVEQSCTDPGVYIVTYTAEHCHIQPTRRNSLAGTVRQKFPTAKSPNKAGGNQTSSTERVQDSNCSENELISPTTPRIITDIIEKDVILKQEKLNESEDQIMIQGGYTNNEFYVSDFFMNDDFFNTHGY